MSIVVEHEKRRYEILERALDVFVDEGFGDVTFQKIADRCGVTRTTLYLYFNNKRDIFNFSIRQFLQNLEDNIINIKNEKTLPHTKKIILVMTAVFESLEENSKLLSVIMDYLVHSMKMKDDFDPEYRVRRRTVRLRRILAGMLIDGIKAGEFKSDLNIKDANELLFSFLESASYRLAVLRRKSVGELKDAMKLAVKHFSI
ncbi:MAG: TetR/AcrR family transcriptional regulator [Treponema sp.]|nr:TetR/AcrR family transcriptional regulator [Treponema sp.]